ncbi:MAG: DUF3726 domain-containing protein [Alphaproteobacteria bacterium]
MRITYNELITITDKCLNALKFPVGETDRIAGMVADLELAGFDGLKMFLNSIKKINTNSVDITIKQTNDNTIDIDLKNSSVIFHLPSIMYYARQRLKYQDSITMNITNAYGRWLAYGELKKIAERGFNVHAHWGRRKVDEAVEYFLSSGNKHPDLYVSNEKQELSILKINISKTSFKQDVNGRHISSNELMEKTNTSICDGVEVDENIWNELYEIAKLGLVENSETSEAQGAGGV